MGISLKGWVFIGLLFVSGTAGALLYKAMCMTDVQLFPGGPYGKYDHAYIQTLFMYIGQLLDFVVPPAKHVVSRWKEKQRSKLAYDGELALLSPPQSPQIKTGEVLPGDLKQPFSLKIFLLFFIPTVVDVIGSTLYNLGLKYALVSVC